MNINLQDPSFLLSVIAIIGTVFTYLMIEKLRRRRSLLTTTNLAKLKKRKFKKSKRLYAPHLSLVPKDIAF